MEAILTPSATPAATTSKTTMTIGRVLSALGVLFLLFDGVTKLIKVAPVVEAFQRLGLPDTLARGIGLLELVCVVVHLIPRTAVVGAILLTGYLGGAICIHLRVDDPLFSHTLFPAYIGALIWSGLLLRDDRARALIG